jgi:hypothetical protein
VQPLENNAAPGSAQNKLAPIRELPPHHAEQELQVSQLRPPQSIAGATCSEAEMNQLYLTSSSPTPRRDFPFTAAESPDGSRESAAAGSSLLQLSQLTAQVVLDCRRMAEVNHAQLSHLQVKRGAGPDSL